MSQPAARPDATDLGPEIEAALGDITAALVRLFVALQREQRQTAAVQTPLAHAADDQRLAYTVPEAAKLVGVSASVMHEQIRAGRITTFRIGARALVSRAELERLAAHGEGEQGPAVLWDRRRKKR